ncbi:Hpt domain-containing protein [Polaribacter sp.]|uniref:Hpt domain-containing protein n=1 Tax=Polaribacter sp. TaxID=1920175 RepID=UPI003F6CA8B8
MLETPNLNYIKEIAEGDKDFELSMLTLLKVEFPKEFKMLKDNFRQQNYAQVALDVHKIKYKISMLGMPLALEIASNFEQNIKKGHTEQYDALLVILNRIDVYLSNK